MRLPDYTVSQFSGLNTFIKDVKTLKPGVATDSLNWLTAKYGDHIELRRGSAILGQTRVDGAGKITGLGVGTRYDGMQVPFWSRGKKIEYYDATADDRVETGSDVLGVTADGEDCWFSPYANLAGAMMYAGSPNSGIYKIPVASPSSAVDQLVNNFRFGVLRFGQGRAFAGQRNGTTAGNQDKTGLYLSDIDKANLSLFTQVTGESIGSSGSTSYSTTLAERTGKRTVMYPSVYAAVGSGEAISAIGQHTPYADVTIGAHTHQKGDLLVVVGAGGMTEINGLLATVVDTNATQVFLNIDSSGFSAYTSGGNLYAAEHFVDDRNGNLVSQFGGTGTINYATGALSVAFSQNTISGPAASYYWEDVTNDGPLDFDTGSTGAGKAKIFRQDDGGTFMAVLPFLDVEYAFHLLKTWAVTTTIDDTSATNLPYRAIGIPYPRAVCETPDGILCIDVSNPNDPKVRRLEIGQNTNNLTIVPTPISEALDLSGHTFDYAVAFRWGDYEIVCCQDSVNGAAESFNSVMYARNVFSSAWDRLGYRASCLAVYGGALIAGDPISSNVFTLFSGFDDDEGPIENYWQDGQLNLGTENLKRAHLMRVTGHIMKDQSIKVSLVLDDGVPVDVFTIEGDGDYVDQGINTPIGSYTIGSKVIGGGGEATAHPFDVTFPIHTDVFQHISARFEAQGIGHAAVNSYTYKDVRDKGRRSLPIKMV